MAPNLRSSSHAWSNNSRPSTPLGATSTASSFTESTRPRKQRRTGRHSRVATDPLQDPPSRTQSRLEQSGNGISDTLSESHVDGNSTEWLEPPLRVPVPSYADTPWSAVSNGANPILSTMRPLGAMPSAADLRKAGLAPVKPSVQNIPAKRGLQATSNGDKASNKPQTPLTPAEEQVPEPVAIKIKPVVDMSQFTTLPVPTSADVDVERIKTAVEKAIRLAVDTNNIPVSRGLLRLWETCHKDPFALSILDSICQENPGPRERSVFQSVMRSAWKEVQAEVGEDLAPAPVLARPRSASSISSLSSAKSLDVETFAPGMEPGATALRTRAKGKQARGGASQANVKELLNHQSAELPPTAATEPQLKDASEEDPNPEETARIKRTRLQKSLPNIVASESRLRSSLASEPASNVPSPAPTTHSGSQAASAAAVPNSRERSESPASSDAGDNRRLTPTLSSDNERLENNDFCHNCNKSGQLLCCDGCPNSFHFSCLNPPLDPANPPEGDWFCPKCSLSRPMSSMLDALDSAQQKDFALPARLRDYFTGVRTGDGGKYEEIVTLPKINRGGRGTRSGRYDDPYLMRTADSKGNMIICTACGRTSNGNRPIIQCDFCPCAFHMDCVDPPLAMPPMQKAGSERRHHNWMCPNHVWHDLAYTVQDEEGYDMVKRIRRPKQPRMVDIEVLPDEEDVQRMEDQEEEGVMYRVSERGLKLDFIYRVKRENEEYKLMKEAADKYLEYATTEFDKLIADAKAFYASENPAIAEDSTTAISNSRTKAEREAAANLISFAQGSQTSSGVEADKINLLIDQLKANEPDSLPSADTEIASLRRLQDLIDQRIKALSAPSQTSQSTSPEHVDAPIEL
ncbi:PHD finger domain protein [Aspergillus ellipticus CBS 707.79]|uniref:PHD finger domain protein n=1 Tax=Aspergillus ellipticus CBS 707.79 TaxID=1448320 RepID=A0A319D2T6_9EURO|nr:PHD finger domain protein [Aspergillus ellipticus CBS 707.79]